MNALVPLITLAKQINKAHAQAAAAAKSALQYALEAGKLLIRAKKQMAHGEWLPWLEANCTCSERSAQRYMKLAENKDRLLKSDTVSDLTVRGALAMLEEKSSEREIVVPAAISPTPKDKSLLVSCSIEEEEQDKVVVSPEHIQAPNKKFNRTNDNIEWAKWTWNPVTGCKHGCRYCYARDIAMRFTGHFRPEFHEERLSAPQNTALPKEAADGERSVFLCSMADLWGEWVPNEWIMKVLESIRKAPQWTFIALTKNPKRYLKFDLPENLWCGATADVQARMDEAIKNFKRLRAKINNILFISCEPMLESIKLPKGDKIIDWLIIGGQSKTIKVPAFQPEWEWVKNLTAQAWIAGVPVYCKPNLDWGRPTEYPKIGQSTNAPLPSRRTIQG